MPPKHWTATCCCCWSPRIERTLTHETDDGLAVLVDAPGFWQARQPMSTVPASTPAATLTGYIRPTAMPTPETEAAV